MTTKEEDLNVDSLIARLLEVRGCRPGKVVQMTEAEVRFVSYHSHPPDIRIVRLLVKPLFVLFSLLRALLLLWCAALLM